MHPLSDTPSSPAQPAATDCGPDDTPAAPFPQLDHRVRYPILDLLRILAIGDIVAIHTTGQYLFAGLGLPVFIITAIALAFRKPGLPSLRVTAAVRSRRIVLPWLFWSCFFGVGYILQVANSPSATLGQVLNPWMILAGTSVHLWFLPFIWAIELGLILTLRSLRWIPAIGVSLATTVAGIALIFITAACYEAPGWNPAIVIPYRAEPLNPPPLTSITPLDEHSLRSEAFGLTVQKSWLFGITSTCFGLAVGRMLSVSVGRRWRLSLAAVAGLLCAGLWWMPVLVPSVWMGQLPWQWWRQTGALAAVTAALLIARPKSPNHRQTAGKTTQKVVHAIATLTMGIYLLHPWVHGQLRGFDSWWPAENRADLSPLNFYVYTFVVWTTTAALVWVLRKTWVRAVL